MSSFIDLHAAAEKTAPAGLLIVDDSPATVWGVLVLCCMGALALAWLLLREQMSLPGAEGSRWLLLGTTAGFACLLSACTTPTKVGIEAMVERETAKSHYVDQVYVQLQKKWRLYLAQSPNQVASGDLRVDFCVNPQAKTENIHVHNTKETSPDLTRFTVLAIQNAELPPMPADVITLLKEQNQESLEFHCKVHIGPPSEGRNRVAAVNKSKAPDIQEWEKESKVLRETKGGQAAALDVNMTPKDRSIQALENELNMLRGTRSSSPVPATKPPEVEDKTPKGRYIRLVTSQVEKKWHTYRLQRRDGITYGSLQIVFYVNKLGRVENLRIVNDKDSNRVLTEFTLQAIRDAEIPPMPANVIPLLPKKDQERLKIEYNVLIY